ncbi:hypothetical protein LCGC14_1410380 [marine sediment metagenome]|uniref:Uncharacterized protein n=1 Tax=marine sediment metagenome TaxID=412755 RepID=A0A0F9M9T9_9ZZZZ
MNTYEKAIQAINEMFGDDKWGKEECIDNLELLKDEIDILLDALGA